MVGKSNLWLILLMILTAKAEYIRRQVSQKLCGDISTISQRHIIGNCSTNILSNCTTKNCDKTSLSDDNKAVTFIVPQWAISNVIIGIYSGYEPGLELLHVVSVFVKFDFYTESGLRPDTVRFRIPDHDKCDEIDISEASSSVHLTSIDYDCFYNVVHNVTSRYAVIKFDIYQLKGDKLYITPYLLFVPTDPFDRSSPSVVMPMIVVNTSLFATGVIEFYFHPISKYDNYSVQLKQLSSNDIYAQISVSVNEVKIAVGSFKEVESGNYVLIIKAESCNLKQCRFESPLFHVSVDSSSFLTEMILFTTLILTILLVILIIIVCGIKYWKIRRSPDDKKVFLFQAANLKYDIVAHLHKEWTKLPNIEAMMQFDWDRNLSYFTWIKEELKFCDIIVIFTKNNLSCNILESTNYSFIAGGFSKTMKAIQDSDESKNKVVAFNVEEDGRPNDLVQDNNFNVKMYPLLVQTHEDAADVEAELRSVQKFVEYKLRKKLPFYIEYDNSCCLQLCKC